MTHKQKNRPRFDYGEVVGKGRGQPTPLTDRRPSTMQQFFETVYRPLRLRGGSFRTTALYEQLIKRFSEYLGHPATMDDLNDLAVAGFLEHRRSMGRSPFTVERERSGLIALWNLAARRGIKKTWPEVPAGKLPRRTPNAWTLPEMQRLFKTARETKGWVNGVKANVFWPALLAVLWETGERIGAVMSARKSDFRPPHLLIRAEARKGGRDDLMHVLTPATCHRVELAMAHDEPTIFFWSGAHSGLWSGWKRLVQRAGLPIGRDCGFHKIRRTAASYLAQKGGNATEFLGHRSPELAAKWYLDPIVTHAGQPAPCDVLPRIDQQPSR